MPRRKTSSRNVKRAARRASEDKYTPSVSTALESPDDYLSAPMAQNRASIPKVLWVLPLILVILAALLWKNKGLLVAATVDGRPIWRLSLDQRLEQRYAPQTLDEMTNEQIVMDQAQKGGIQITDQDVTSKIAEIEKSLQGRISLSDALTQQGMTMADLKNQVKIQLIIEKLTATSVGVTDQEISDYLEKNKALLTATDEAGLKQQAKDAIIRNKKSQAFQKLFQDLKKNAKVTKFI